jgi:lipid II:glycine glycyltransferase (peptidoglycan interpeptide bridge formation enzyme)
MKEEVTIQFSHSPKSIKEFYRLNCMTRKEHGLPPQPFKFFKKVHEEIISRKWGHIVLAIHKNKAIAGAVYFHHGGKALYKYGASDRNHQHLRANNLIMWKAIEWYCRNGYKTFCFGRTEPENQGLRQFKSGWGTQEHVIKYYKYDLKKDTFVKNNPVVKPVYYKVLKKMPIPLLEIMGTLLYRHMG